MCGLSAEQGVTAELFGAPPEVSVAVVQAEEVVGGEGVTGLVGGESGVPVAEFVCEELGEFREVFLGVGTVYIPDCRSDCGLEGGSPAVV